VWRYDQPAMPMKGVGVSAVLTVVLWGAWDWASNDGHPTIGLIAGILLVAAAIALAGLLALTLLGLARIGARRAGARRARSRGIPPSAEPDAAAPGRRIAA
jgi:hypothetical protein